MLVDLDLQRKTVLAIIFDRDELLSRLKQLEEAHATIVIITSRSLASLVGKSSRSKITIIKTDLGESSLLKKTKKNIESCNPFLTVIFTCSHDLDEKISETARKSGSLIYVVDMPLLNDLNMPAIARFGKIRVAISTEGLSPAMARTIRKRLESQIRKEDILQVDLQGELREEIKRLFPKMQERKKIIYGLISDKSINNALRHGRYSQAVSLARKRIKNSGN